MIEVKKVASYIFNRYKKEFDEKVSEMKLHKLLYFTQRESLIQKGEPMFEEEFLAWRYGPVLPEIRSCYANNLFNDMPTEDFISDNRSIFDFVFSNYAPKDAWSLSRLTHGEYSWINARGNLFPNQNGNNPLAVEDIRRDAERIKLRRFLINEIQKERNVGR